MSATRLSSLADVRGDPEPLTAYVDEPVPWVLVMRVRGELDTTGAAQLQRVMEERLMPPPVHLILDLSDVTFLSSVGIDLLVRTGRDMRSDQVQFSVVGPHQPAVRGALKSTDELLPLLATVDSVTSALAGSDPSPPTYER